MCWKITSHNFNKVILRYTLQLNASFLCSPLEQIISCESEEDINENLTVSMTSSRLDYPACVGKNLTLTCSIYGQALTWFLNGIELHRYDGDAVCGDNKRVEIANQPSSFIT